METNLGNYFRGFLKKNNLKVTPERMAIIKELFKVEQHFDADEFFLHLKNNKIAVSRATVYRSLEILEKAGIVVKYSMGEGHAHYEMVWQQEHHDHIICTECGKIIEFTDEKIERRQLEICKEKGVKILRHSLQIWGICSSCIKLYKK